MRDLKVLLTACGCPGASTLIRMLKNNGERHVEVIGVDMDSEAVGRFLCDGFHQVPSGQSPDYIPEMIEVVEAEKPDVLLPESSNEIMSLAMNRDELESYGVKVMVSDPLPVHQSLNKYAMYQALEGAIPLPSYAPAYSLDGFHEALRSIGYPEKPVVFKPFASKGSRGVRIIDPDIDRRHQLLREKPMSKYMSLEEFDSIFESGSFPPLLVMEYLEGEERTADCLCFDGEMLLTTCKTVEQARWGVIVRGELIRAPELIELTKRILEKIKLSYCVNIQFIGSQLLEINPRVSTFIYQEDFIQPYLAIKLALGELSSESVSDLYNKVNYGRRMVRYMDQVFFKEDHEFV